MKATTGGDVPAEVDVGVDQSRREHSGPEVDIGTPARGPHFDDAVPTHDDVDIPAGATDAVEHRRGTNDDGRRVADLGGGW